MFVYYLFLKGKTAEKEDKSERGEDNGSLAIRIKTEINIKKND